MKTSSINPVPSWQLVLFVTDGVSLLVEEVHDKFSQIFFEAILVRIACDLRAPRQLLLGFEAHPEAITFPPVGALLVLTARHNVPIGFPQHLFSVHDHGRLRSSWEPQLLPRPDCISSRLRAEEYDRPVTQSIATLELVFEDDPHPISSAGRLPEP